MKIMTEKTQYIRKNQRLPQEIKIHFDQISDNSTRDILIQALVEANWTYESISGASGLTRERIRQISNRISAHSKDGGYNLGFEIPEPPLKPEKVGPTYIEPAPKTLERLLELQPYAQLVRSNGTKYREEAEEYTKLLDHAHTVEGVTLYRLAKRLGVTHGALRFRLVRYGYKQPVTATSKVYQTIKQDNRPQAK
jgi:hypothetical protein|tara:strand:- start:684 stop:1268 length:585 start_codon:yes stop_codon:yes gene_type:complete